MTMIPTATGYDLIPAPRLSPRPAHRAVMTTTAAWANFASRAGLAPVHEPGRHVAVPALWVHAAEDQARVRDIIRDSAR